MRKLGGPVVGLWNTAMRCSETTTRCGGGQDLVDPIDICVRVAQPLPAVDPVVLKILSTESGRMSGNSG